MDEGLSVEEVCDELLAELSAQEGDETALAEVESIDAIRRAIEEAAKEAARRVREAAEAFLKKSVNAASQTANML